ncbi:hypothetical protein BDW62DRAFT_193123, partial [Aspergillus aurantiobrunneus]
IYYCYSEATFEASNSNSTSLQPLVYVPRVGPALRSKLTTTDRGLSSYRLDVEDFEEGTLGKINQDTASLQYLARVRDRSKERFH